VSHRPHRKRARAFYRDLLLVGLVKLRGVRVVYHLHTKGISSRQHRWLDNLLYQALFADSSVILLSRRLYADIQNTSHRPASITALMESRLPKTPRFLGARETRP